MGLAVHPRQDVFESLGGKGVSALKAGVANGAGRAQARVGLRCGALDVVGVSGVLVFGRRNQQQRPRRDQRDKIVDVGDVQDPRDDLRQLDAGARRMRAR